MTWDPGKREPESKVVEATVPERIFPYVIASVGESDDASITDAENIVSRTEFDSHANMIVVSKNAHIINFTGKKANVQPYNPNYDPQEIPIVDAAVLYECPYSGGK